MSTRIGLYRQSIFVGALAAMLAVSGARSQDGAPAVWRVNKSSGDVWVTSPSVQPAALTGETVLKAGDAIRTGRNGRVLVTRGNEAILIAPNSVIAIPVAQKDASTTTIIQRAGSILLDVEKRNVKHFEVETPYLVAVVKGTQFNVSVGPNEARVDVVRGEVEVADFKSGQIASVRPGQTAAVTARGKGGLSLSGAGALGPVRPGQPRAPTVSRVPVPRAGLSVPRGIDGQQARALAGTRAAAAVEPGRGHGLRIGAPLGELKIDVHKVSNGLAREPSTSAGGRADRTVWNSGDIIPGNGLGKSYNAGNNGSGNGAGSTKGSSGGNGNAGGVGNGNASALANSNAGGNGNGSVFGLAGGNGNDHRNSRSRGRN
jgi:hypothetical protein